MKQVYLGGPITGLEFDEAKDWREEFAQRLATYGWHSLSPMRDKEKFRVPGKLSAFFDEGAAAVNQDLTDIDVCDAVIINVLDAERVSLGSMAEMGYAYALGRPIILVTDGEENVHHHVFTDYMAAEQVDSLDNALITLNDIYQHTVAEKVPYAPSLPEEKNFLVPLTV